MTLTFTQKWLCHWGIVFHKHILYLPSLSYIKQISTWTCCKPSVYITLSLCCVKDVTIVPCDKSHNPTVPSADALAKTFLQLRKHTISLSLYRNIWCVYMLSACVYTISGLENVLWCTLWVLQRKWKITSMCISFLINDTKMYDWYFIISVWTFIIIQYYFYPNNYM